MSPQNIYDNPTFFAGYKELRARKMTLNSAIEQGAMESLLPAQMSGHHVLDLGCGFGDMSRIIRAAGAASVQGIDSSELMLAEAMRLTDDNGIEYRRSSIESFDFSTDKYDLVIASLVLHYIGDYETVISKIAESLTSNGRLVFSVEHPICTSIGLNQWHLDRKGGKAFWPVDRYWEEGVRHSHWFVDGVVKYHRTLQTYINTLIEAGLRIHRILEPAPGPSAIESAPELLDQLRRPPFLIVSAEKGK